MEKKRRGFTLIELLIVVAIIAILAMIAVPNFLEAQVRAKISRVRTDMRSLIVAFEAYFVDWNGYPLHRDFPSWPIPANFRPWFAALTTPVSFITSMPVDPFCAPSSRGYQGLVPWSGYWYHYEALTNTWTTGAGPNSPYDWMPADWGPYNGFVADMVGRGFFYLLESPGPDMDRDVDTKVGMAAFYDPTNGTVSSGDIIRLGPGASDYIAFR
jgi:prepilin-type N-terminal cleavage/methylation domain-containing protein